MTNSILGLCHCASGSENGIQCFFVCFFVKNCKRDNSAQQSAALDFTVDVGGIEV